MIHSNLVDQMFFCCTHTYINTYTQVCVFMYSYNVNGEVSHFKVYIIHIKMYIWGCLLEGRH